MSNKTVSNILTVWFAMLISSGIFAIFISYVTDEEPKTCAELSSDFMINCMSLLDADGLRYAHGAECEESRRRIVLDCQEERSR